MQWKTKWYWKLRYKIVVCRWVGHTFVFMPGYWIFRPQNFCTRCGLFSPVLDIDEYK